MSDSPSTNVVSPNPESPATPSGKSRSRFGSMLRSRGKELFQRAKISGVAAFEKSKAGLKLAADELVSHVKEVYDHGNEAGQGMGKAASKVKVPEKVKRVSNSGKVMAKKTATVAKKTSLRIKEFVEPTFYAKMDADEDAAFALVYHYSMQFGNLHNYAAETEKLGKQAGKIIVQREKDTSLFKTRCTSLQAELSALPNVMTILTTTVQSVYDLRISLHGVEAELDALEQLIDDVELNKAKEHNKHVIATYKGATSAAVAKQKKAAEVEYKKARKEASKSTSKHMKDRQHVLDDKFREQMNLFRDQGKSDVLASDNTIPENTLSRQNSDIISAEDKELFAKFLESQRNSRANTPSQSQKNSRSASPVQESSTDAQVPNNTNQGVEEEEPISTEVSFPDANGESDVSKNENIENGDDSQKSSVNTDAKDDVSSSTEESAAILAEGSTAKESGTDTSIPKATGKSKKKKKGKKKNVPSAEPQTADKDTESAAGDPIENVSEDPSKQEAPQEME